MGAVRADAEHARARKRASARARARAERGMCASSKAPGHGPAARATVGASRAGGGARGVRQAGGPLAARYATTTAAAARRAA